MKPVKSLIVTILPALLVCSQTISAFAATAPTPKEEVIYIMTDTSGKVDDVEAVNIFNGGNIVDYGNYSAVKPLNTTDTITQNGTQITFSSDAEKVYYQGTMKDTTIPWNVSIRYFLDGKEYSGNDIAGKSGALEIHFTISENESYKGDFYESYALQAAFTLNADQCENICADEATIANVGNNKQLSYIILPGKGIDTTIRADVTDFEMDAITINGIRLNLNLGDDEDVLTDKINQFSTAIESLDNGVSELNDGAQKLSSATNSLNSKVGELHNGTGSLATGTENLSSGLASISSQSGQLTDAAYSAFEGLCNAAAVTLNNLLREKGIGSVTLTPSTYSSVLTELLNKMSANTADAATASAAGQISALKAQLDNYNSFYQGLVQYTDAVNSAAGGANTLKQNMDTLYSNTGTLQSSVGKLNDAAGKLYDGSQQLADGTSEFVDQIPYSETLLEGEIDSVSSLLTGSDSEIVSFVSDQNTNVNSVQFVIKTGSIEKPEVIIDNTQEEVTLTFWQKLIQLFH